MSFVKQWLTFLWMLSKTEKKSTARRKAEIFVVKYGQAELTYERLRIDSSSLWK